MPSWRRQWLPQLQLGEKILAFPEGLALFKNKVVDMPVVCMSWCACRSSVFCRGAEAGSHGPACALDTVFDVPVALVVQFVYFPVVAQRRLPMVFLTIESPQFPVGKVIDVPVVKVVRVGGALCTGTGPGLTPAIRAGKGWWGRRES